MTPAHPARGSEQIEPLTVATTAPLPATMEGEQPPNRKRQPAFDHVSVTVTPIAPESPRMKAILELLFPTDETVRAA